MRRRLLLACALAFVHCGSPSLKRVADDYAKHTGLSFADCGSSAVDSMSTCTADDPVDDCLLAAYASCTPSRAELTQFTPAGDPLYSQIFVATSATGCEIVQIVDTHSDKHGPHSIYRARCTTFMTSGCFLAVPDGCITDHTY